MYVEDLSELLTPKLLHEGSRFWAKKKPPEGGFIFS